MAGVIRLFKKQTKRVLTYQWMRSRTLTIIKKHVAMESLVKRTSKFISLVVSFVVNSLLTYSICSYLSVDWKWKNGMSFDTLLVDQNKAYNIKPKAGGQLPFGKC